MVAAPSPVEVLLAVEDVSVRVSTTLIVLVGTLDKVIESGSELDEEGSRDLEADDLERDSEVVTKRMLVTISSHRLPLRLTSRCSDRRKRCLFTRVGGS